LTEGMTFGLFIDVMLKSPRLEPYLGTVREAQ